MPRTRLIPLREFPSALPFYGPRPKNIESSCTPRPETGTTPTCFRPSTTRPTESTTGKRRQSRHPAHDREFANTTEEGRKPRVNSARDVDEEYPPAPHTRISVNP